VKAAYNQALGYLNDVEYAIGDAHRAARMIEVDAIPSWAERAKAGQGVDGRTRAAIGAGGAARWNSETILCAIREWSVSHDGAVPSSKDAKRSNGALPTSKAVAAVFGSWNAGIGAAGLTPYPQGGSDPRLREKATKWTREACIRALQEWSAANGGRTPTQLEMARDPNLPHYSGLRKAFDSGTAAMVAAGLKAREPGETEKYGLNRDRRSRQAERDGVQP
jgi:hypothetical protein